MITLGAMSGTSTDGIDVAALELIEGRFHYLGMVSEEFTPELRSNLLRFQQVPWQPVPQGNVSSTLQADALTELLLTRKALSEAYVSASKALLGQLSLDPSQVSVVGVHGQTLRHRPDLGFTYQMIDPALIATGLGIDVVSDLRSKDVALGGQGAPLVPAFHEAWLHGAGMKPGPDEGLAVLNLGGFSNLTVLTAGGMPYPVIGGDCGPANVWMDHVMRRHCDQLFDAQGQFARQGQLNLVLLNQLQSHPFFDRVWPKSTGRDDFTIDTLDRAVAATANIQGAQPSPADLMRTLVELCAKSVVSCLKPYEVRALWVCGGGALNLFLLERIQALLDERVRVGTTSQLGLPVMSVEAAAFAWLAAQFLHRLPGNCVGVTGASRPTVLGSLTCFH